MNFLFPQNKNKNPIMAPWVLHTQLSLPPRWLLDLTFYVSHPVWLCFNHKGLIEFNHQSEMLLPKELAFVLSVWGVLPKVQTVIPYLRSLGLCLAITLSVSSFWLPHFQKHPALYILPPALGFTISYTAMLLNIFTVSNIWNMICMKAGIFASFVFWTPLPRTRPDV